MVLKIACLFVTCFLGLANSSGAATLHWSGADSTTVIRSVVRQKAVFLHLEESVQKLPLTVRSDSLGGVHVLCSSYDCVPVYAMDTVEVTVADSTLYVQADVVASVLGCEAKTRKREQITLTCSVPATRVGMAVGEPAPGFRLPAVRDSLVSLSDLRARGPVVVAFIRSGEWDPHSKALLARLEAAQDSLRGAGVQVVAIHGYNAEAGKKWRGDLNLSFPLLADELSAVMRGYDVFDKGNLPHPALFLVDRGGVIRLRHLFQDLTAPPDLAPLMQAVTGLK